MLVDKYLSLFGRHPISILTLYLVVLIAAALWISSEHRKRQNQREQLSWRKHLNAIRLDHDTHL